MAFVDELIGGFDRALRAVAGVHQAARPSPAHDVPDFPALSADARASAAALMRVNHVGEVCAQALYEGQSLAAREPRTRESLLEAAREERDHLAWCAERIEELGGRTSLLNPAWYAGSFALGLVASALGDRWNLAFLAETERQVEAHLNGHLERLSADDRRTRAVVEAMRDDEARHRQTAVDLGAAALPPPIQAAMRAAAKVMTTVSYRI
ncbi:MAG TPA: 2-polyprenyl-3-methyl-6-methoxy-1,4-benzoquinone monooxygenase [Burkholderiales bacterium]|jgi:ubiquinone biosynthesis monooxygenase Coq7|nr:2-polyprenyl-3-methyl-6-methoxy-1,4-benzoquinone monooxygenase [Burkholderiales bacterium]